MGSAPSALSAGKMSGGKHTHTQKNSTIKHTHTDRTMTHLSHCTVTSPAALFMTTPDDMAPEEQVVHNVIPLKDKMPRPGFSDVHRKANKEPDSDVCQVPVRRPTY